MISHVLASAGITLSLLKDSFAMPFHMSKLQKRFESYSLGSIAAERGGKIAAAASSTTYFYSQAVLDHFVQNVATAPTLWSQRYYVDEQFWCGAGCPVFLYIGGEGPQGPVTSRLLMFSLAQTHKALILALEHRFYGESFPTKDMSTDNLKYLTSSQALADLARFRNYIALNTASTSPVGDPASSPPLRLKASASSSAFVVFGGSYPGNLAAWFKTEYPSLAVGSVASSAPVYAEFDFDQYAQVTGASMALAVVGGGPSCYTNLEKGITELHSLLTSTIPFGISPAIPPALLPCNPMKTSLDLVAYETEIYGNFQGTVQYNLEGQPITVASLCKALLSSSSPLEGLAAATALFANQSLPFQERCIASSYEESIVAPVANTSFSGPGCDRNCSSGRQWTWQSCNEFGYFQTTTGTGHPFAAFAENGIDAAGTTLCKLAFDMPSYDAPNTLWTNTKTGNRFVSAANITFVNGDVDPWHALSVVPPNASFYQSCNGGICTPQSLDSRSYMVFISGTAHCRDMYAPNALSPAVNDTQSLMLAHSDIINSVALFLS